MCTWGKLHFFNKWSLTKTLKHFNNFWNRIINFLLQYCQHIKNLLFNCFNCCLIRQVSEGLLNSLLILANPATYLLRKMMKDSNNSPKAEDATTFKNNPKEKERTTELRELRTLNEQLLLPRYQENIWNVLSLERKLSYFVNFFFV